MEAEEDSAENWESIPLHQLFEHMNNQSKLVSEWEFLRKLEQNQTFSALIEEQNQEKNRYKGNFTPDHSRVILGKKMKWNKRKKVVINSKNDGEIRKKEYTQENSTNIELFKNSSVDSSGSYTSERMDDITGLQDFKHDSEGSSVEYAEKLQYNLEIEIMKEVAEETSLERVSKEPNTAECVITVETDSRTVSVDITKSIAESPVFAEAGASTDNGKKEVTESVNYINANYIKNYNNEIAYVACQAPLTSTINDFWSMIYDNDVPLIIMLSSLIENSTVKANRYWPISPEEANKLYCSVESGLKKMGNNKPDNSSSNFTNHNSNTNFVATSNFPSINSSESSSDSSKTGNVEPDGKRNSKNWRKEVMGGATTTGNSAGNVLPTAQLMTPACDAPLFCEINKPQATPSSPIHNNKNKNKNIQNTNCAANKGEQHDSPPTGSSIPTSSPLAACSPPLGTPSAPTSSRSPNRLGTSPASNSLNSSSPTVATSSLEKQPWDRNRIYSSILSRDIVNGDTLSEFYGYHLRSNRQRKKGSSRLVESGFQTYDDEEIMEDSNCIGDSTSDDEDERRKIEENIGEEDSYANFGRVVIATEICGDIVVHLNKRIVDNDIIIRCLNLKRLGVGKSRGKPVIHVQYLGWPDQGVPQNPNSVIKIVNLMQCILRSTPLHGPPVIHCSAGVGRSGCLIGIHMELMRMEQEREQTNKQPYINLLKAVLWMRNHRLHMVQQYSQYQFMYKVLYYLFKKRFSGEFMGRQRQQRLDSDTNNQIV